MSPNSGAAAAAADVAVIVEDLSPIRIRDDNANIDDDDDHEKEEEVFAANNAIIGSEKDSLSFDETTSNDNENGDNDERVNHDDDDMPTQMIMDVETARSCCPLVNDQNNDFDQTCRLVIKFGVAAMRYGSTADRVEKFLRNAMQQFGYDGVFKITQSELLCCFQEDIDSMGRNTQIVAIESTGFNLNKLGLLAELAKRVVDEHEQSTFEDTFDKLKAIDQAPDPFSNTAVALSYPAVGAALAMVLEGGWWDVWLGLISGGLVFGVIMAFAKFGTKETQQWVNLVASFVCATFATSLKAWLPHINVTLVTLSGVAILLPGYGVSLGTAELVSNHIISGASRLINGLVTLLWLTLGLWLGKNLGDSIFDIEPTEVQVEPVSMAWQALFVPLLFVAVTVVFQNSYRDAPWAILGMTVTYGTSLIASLFVEKSLGTFLSSVAMTVFANLWAKWYDRPNTLILLPSFVLKVSGSIGFLGLARLVEGERYVGLQQFMQMFLIALLIVAGVFAGNTLVPTRTTL